MPDRPPPLTEPGQRPRSGPRQRWLLAALCGVFLMVLLAVVAAGTQAHYSQQVLPAPAGPTLQNPVTGAVGQLATVVILGGAEILLVLVLIFFPWRDFKHIGKATPVPVQMRRRDSLKLVALAFGMLIALIVLLALGLKRRKRLFHLAGPNRAGAGSPHPAVTSGSIAVGSDLLAATAVVVVILLIVAAVVLVRARRRSHWRSQTSGMTPISDLPEELASVMAGGLEELSLGGDPRSAVILAYLRLEQALGERGLERRRFETHLEYLERALAGMRLSREHLVRLTELFQAARYSDHPVDPGMREEAQSALGSLRQQLLGQG